MIVLNISFALKISIDRFLDAHKMRKIAKTTIGRNSLINEDGVKNTSRNITNCSKDLKALDDNVLRSSHPFCMRVCCL